MSVTFELHDDIALDLVDRPLVELAAAGRTFADWDRGRRG